MSKKNKALEFSTASGRRRRHGSAAASDASRRQWRKIWKKAIAIFALRLLNVGCARPKGCIKRASKNTLAAATMIFSFFFSELKKSSEDRRVLILFYKSSLWGSHSGLLSACRSDVSITFGITGRRLQAQCGSLHPPRQRLPLYVPIYLFMKSDHVDEGTKQGARLSGTNETSCNPEMTWSGQQHCLKVEMILQYHKQYLFP